MLKRIMEKVFECIVCFIIGVSLSYICLYHPNSHVNVNNKIDNFTYTNSHTYQDTKIRDSIAKDLFYRVRGYKQNDINQHQGVKKELQLINYERQKRGLPLLRENNTLDDIAKIRAKQVFYVNYIENKHDDTDIHEERGNANNSEEDILLSKFKFPNTKTAENACSISQGNSIFHNGRRGRVEYKNIDSAQRMASVVNNNSMYHDQSNGNGHRHAIINPYYRYVGIAMYYQPYIHSAIFVEDFTN